MSQMTARRRETPFPLLLSEYDRHHLLLFKRVAVLATPDQPPVMCICEGLDETGRLVVRSANMRHAFIAGHVEML